MAASSFLVNQADWNETGNTFRQNSGTEFLNYSSLFTRFLKGQLIFSQRALAWLGRTHIEASINKIYAHFSTEEWQNLVAVRSSLPSWMAESIGKIDFRIKKHGRAIPHSES